MKTLNTPRFKFIADALNGSGGFRPTVTYSGAAPDSVDPAASYLVPYRRETDLKYASRCHLAWYVSDLRSACQRFVGHLAAKPPRRELGNAQLAKFADDCDGQGNALDVFWQNFALEAKARGSAFLLVDGPPSELGAERQLPYLAFIAPERVVGVDTDIFGNLVAAAVSDTLIIGGRERAVVREYDSESWRILLEGQVLAEEVHGLGVCPVLSFSETGIMGAEGAFSQIADLSRRLFNLRSELDELLRSQTFGLLTLRVPESRYPIDASTISIGTDSLLQTFEGGAEFVAPPEGPGRLYAETIAAIERQIREVGLLIDLPSQAESGVALAMRFQSLNTALTAFARRMEDFERRMWSVVCRWLMLPDDRASVEWSRDYQLADIGRELEVLSLMQAAGFSPAALLAKQRQILALDYPSLTAGELDQLLEAVADA